jgi:hypothetical protein
MSGKENGKEGVKTQWMAGVLRFLIEVSWYILIIGAIAFVAVPLLSPATWPAAISVNLAPDSTSPELIWQGTGSEEIELYQTTAIIKIQGVGTGMRFFLSLGSLITLGISLAILFLLRRVFDAFLKGEPFATKNAPRIRLMGILSIVQEVLRQLFSLWKSSWMVSNSTMAGMTLKPHFDLDIGTVILGCFLILLAQVFSLGTRLREDQALTV